VALLAGRTVPGWTSLMVVISILGCAVLIGSGSWAVRRKIYEESKGRPLYLVARTFNVSSAEEPNRSGPAARTPDCAGDSYRGRE